MSLLGLLQSVGFNTKDTEHCFEKMSGNNARRATSKPFTGAVAELKDSTYDMPSQGRDSNRQCLETTEAIALYMGRVMSGADTGELCNSILTLVLTEPVAPIAPADPSARP